MTLKNIEKKNKKFKNIKKFIKQRKNLKLRN